MPPSLFSMMFSAMRRMYFRTVIAVFQSGAASMEGYSTQGVKHLLDGLLYGNDMYKSASSWVKVQVAMDHVITLQSAQTM